MNTEHTFYSTNLGTSDGHRVVVRNVPFSITLKSGEVLKSSPYDGGHIIKNVPDDWMDQLDGGGNVG